MNMLRIVVINDLFEHQFHPRGNATKGANVPIFRVFGNGKHPFVPIINLGNLVPGLVVFFKPKWNVAGTYATNFPFFFTIAFLQVGGAAQHHDFLLEKIRWHIKIAHGENLLPSCPCNGVQHIFGHGNSLGILTCGARRQRKKIGTSGPSHIGLALNGLAPPFLGNFVVVVVRNSLSKGLLDVIGR